MAPGLRRYVRQHHVALLALFFSLGLGSAWAATELSRNEVKSKHIAPRAVKRSDLGANAVNSAKVANGSLQDVDFAPGELPGGPQGPTGPQGATGPAGATTTVIRQSNDTAGWTAGGLVDHVASCLPGETAVGAGWETFNHSDYNQFTPRIFTPLSDGWRLIANTSVTDADAFMAVYVRCASP